MFSGALGGPMAALGPLIGENLGVERVPMRFPRTGCGTASRIGDAVDVEVEDVVPFGVETGEPARLIGIFHPVGRELTIAQADALEVSAFGIELRGQGGLLDAVLLVGLSAAGSRTRSRPSGRGARAAFAPARAARPRSRCCFALAARRLVVDRRPDGGHGRGPGTDLGTLGFYLGVWVVMMAAMMFPSVAPTVAALRGA